MLFVNEMPSEAREKMVYASLYLFTSKGFKETSVLDIVEQARVSKTTFYNHFTTKEDLLVSLCRQLIEEMIQSVKEAVAQEKKVTYKAYAGIRRYIEICMTRKHAARLLLIISGGISQETAQVRREAIHQFAELIFETVQSILPNESVDQSFRTVSKAMVGAINEVVLERLITEDSTKDLDELAHLLNRIVVGAFSQLAPG
ncbi:MAG TPA: TetR/AcrR family transcriptional regulator [Sporolactobacillaceae bacterium]|nr:TetR/AcrR family transcriptional regulator [Sporolactobacillaceae bacterium]